MEFLDCDQGDVLELVSRSLEPLIQLGEKGRLGGEGEQVLVAGLPLGVFYDALQHVRLEEFGVDHKGEGLTSEIVEPRPDAPVKS